MSVAQAGGEAGAAAGPIPVVVHLSGSLRGTTERLAGDVLRLGAAADADIHFPARREPAVAPQHAVLRRRGATYELEVEPERTVRLNGKPVERAVLASGDRLQVGEGGPQLRFRVYPDAQSAHKSMAEALTDCVDCARYGAGSMSEKAGVLLRGVPHELTRQTSRSFRRAVAAALVVLVAAVGVLAWRSVRLERQIATAQLRVSGIAELVDRDILSHDDLADVRREIQAGLSQTEGRLAVLEAGAGAARRVVSEAARSVVFLQGAYGFAEEGTGRLLRFARVGPDGRPQSGPGNEPPVSPEGEGPPVESFFTGTAFVVTAGGLLLTNRHVALPWEDDPVVAQIRSRGFTPVIRRFLGYLPGVPEPFEVELEAASAEADLAVLRSAGVTDRAPPLELSDAPPEPGDEVLVLGYPTGIRALLARADEAFVEELMAGPPVDFWEVARRLAAAGLMAPLATRGIVGQVSPAAVAYDAETTSGGSGGPAVNLAGRVVAINAAILPEFGGSNLGVPAAAARDLLQEAAEGAAAAAGETEAAGAQSGATAPEPLDAGNG